MITSYKQQFRKIAVWSVVVFVLLFLFRLGYGYVAKDEHNNNEYYSNFFRGLADARKNYASEKVELNFAPGPASPVPVMDASQKYEKTAIIKTKTAEFEQDEKRIKEQVKAYHAVIQYEQSMGQKGNRELHLLVGVNPEQFDAFYVALKKIGAIKATEITKVDKTNEYRQLNAQRISIEKTLQSLYELKAREGKITDFIELNNRIMSVEEKLQNLGVDLGNFNTENEFCTVKLSVYEGATEKSISFYYRVKIAIQWTIKYFAVLAFAALCLSMVAALALYIGAKLSVMVGRFGQK